MNETQTQRQNSAGMIIALTMAFALGYSILRYHIVGPVPWKDLSFFILNKGICMGAFLLLTLNFSLGPAKNPTGRDLNHASAALQLLKRATSLSGELCLAVTHFNSRRGRKQLIEVP